MDRIVLRLTDCLKKGKSPHIVLTSAEFIEESTRGVHSFLDKGDNSYCGPVRGPHVSMSL